MISYTESKIRSKITFRGIKTKTSYAADTPDEAASYCSDWWTITDWGFMALCYLLESEFMILHLKDQRYFEIIMVSREWRSSLDGVNKTKINNWEKLL